ncbi:MAG: metallophosphoesterase [Firmicutes bacterium]|nr:metallophosphoesterase [Bacillota bacterium]MCL2770715.1 metallophosphoesterase [Bacillota bacterium]
MALRTFVVGDIHGNFNELLVLEHKIQKKAGGNYELICTGDIMNGGPESYQLFKYVKDNPKFKLILGNNDEFFCSGKIEGNVFKDMGVADAISCNEASGVTETWKSILKFYKRNDVPVFRENYGSGEWGGFGGLSPSVDGFDDISFVNAILAYEHFFKDEFKKPENSSIIKQIKKRCVEFSKVKTGVEYTKRLITEKDSVTKRLMADNAGYITESTPRYRNFKEDFSRHIDMLHKKMQTGVYGRSRMNDDPAFEKYIIEGKAVGDALSKTPYCDKDYACLIFLAHVFKEMKHYFERCPTSKIIKEEDKTIGLSHAGYFTRDTEGRIIDQCYLLTSQPEYKAMVYDVDAYGCGWLPDTKPGFEPYETRRKNIFYKTGVNERWGRGHGKNTELPVRNEENTFEGICYTIHGHVPRNEKLGNVVCSFGNNGELVAVNLDGGAKGMEKDGDSVIRCFEPKTGIFLTVNTENEIVRSTLEDYRKAYAIQKAFGTVSPASNVREVVKTTIKNQHTL